MLRIISERNLDINEKLNACSIDWQQALEGVNWSRLRQILKKTGFDLSANFT
jgi:hypothetical protein